MRHFLIAWFVVSLMLIVFLNFDSYLDKPCIEQKFEYRSNNPFEKIEPGYIKCCIDTGRYIDHVYSSRQYCEIIKVNER